MTIPFTNPRVVPVALDQAGLTWFDTLRNQYQSAVAAEPQPSLVQAKAREEVEKILTKTTEELTTQDVFTLEDWLLELLPLEQLMTRVYSLRDDFLEVFGESAWGKISPELLPKVADAEPKKLVAEAQRLQECLHWQSSIRPWAHQIRQRMMFGIFLVLLVVLPIVSIVIWWSGWYLPGVLLIIGVLGGTVSSIQRIQGADLANSRALTIARHDGLFLGVIISPLLGGIFSLLISLMLIAGAVTPGLLIPDLTLNRLIKISNNAVCEQTLNDATLQKTSSTIQEVNPNNQLESVSNSQASIAEDPSNPQATKPGSCQFDYMGLSLCFAHGKDLAILIMWGFCAGFFERLVPDMLTRLALPKKN